MCSICDIKQYESRSTNPSNFHGALVFHSEQGCTQRGPGNNILKEADISDRTCSNTSASLKNLESCVTVEMLPSWDCNDQKAGVGFHNEVWLPTPPTVCIHPRTSPLLNSLVLMNNILL